MMELFAVNSQVVFATLILLIVLSVATWSIALFKLWRQVQDGKRNRSFGEAFWAARD